MIIKTVTLSGPGGTPSVTLGELTPAGADLVGYTLTQCDIDPAPIVVSQQNLPLIAGGIVSGGRYGIRSVELAGFIVANDADEANELRRELVAILKDHGETETITITYDLEGEERELTGLLDGSVIFRPAGGHYLEYSARIVCGDPVAYSTVTKSAIASTAPGTTMTNAGDARVWPRIVVDFTGSSTSMKVGNTSTGMFLEVTSITTTSSSEMEIITTPGYESIILDGVNILDKLTAASRFWYLKPGANQVYRTSGATVTVEWSDGWVS